MSYEIPGLSVSLRAPTTAFSARQYYGVNASSSAGYFKTGVGNKASSGGPIMGILQDAPTVAGEPCNVMVNGVSKAYCISNVPTGDFFIFSTSGAIRSSTAAAAQSVLYGPVLIGATSGGYATVVVQPIGITT